MLTHIALDSLRLRNAVQLHQRRIADGMQNVGHQIRRLCAGGEEREIMRFNFIHEYIPKGNYYNAAIIANLTHVRIIVGETIMNYIDSTDSSSIPKT